MKFFISHSSKDAELATKLTELITEVDEQNNVFCSSITGTIKTGEDYVEVIKDELDVCDVFIALISSNYHQSQYSLIELGIAYGTILKEKKERVLYPFVVPPMLREYSLLHTPLSHINTSYLNNPESIMEFIAQTKKEESSLSKQQEEYLACEFIKDVNMVIMRNGNILGNAMVLSVCSRGDCSYAINHTVEKDVHVVNFSVDERVYKRENEFISLVFKFPLLFDFYSYQATNPDIGFMCEVDNYTGSVEYMDIEFKYLESNQLLKKEVLQLKTGTNTVLIPLSQINIEGLRKISEICFVVKGNYFRDMKGMYRISKLSVK